MDKARQRFAGLHEELNAMNPSDRRYKVHIWYPEFLLKQNKINTVSSTVSSLVCPQRNETLINISNSLPTGNRKSNRPRISCKQYEELIFGQKAKVMKNMI